MSFQISKNKMTFLADNNEKNLAYTNAEEVYIAHDSHQVIGEVDVSGGGINHFIGMIHLHCPGVAEANMPECRISAEWDGSGETTNLQLNNHIGANSGQSRGSGLFSFKDTLSKVTIMLLPNQVSRDNSVAFTIPANSQILFSLNPQDAVLNQLSFTGPSVPSTPSGFTLSNTTVDYTGTWQYAGNVRRVGPSFTTSTDIGIYRHDYGTAVYVLYYFAEGVSEAPTWTLAQFGNNTGANAISPTHDFLSSASMTGDQLAYMSGSSQTVNGTQYPPSDVLNGTMTVG